MNPHKFVNCRSNNNTLSSSQQNPLAYSLPRRIKSIIEEKDRTPKFSPTTFISTSHNFSKITEKDCTDLQSLVKKSVDDINDLLSLKQLQSSFNDHIDSSRRKNQSVSLSKDVRRNLNDELNLKESISKESKPNFTFNINNFINVPNHSKARSITRYVDDEDSFDNVNYANNQNNTQVNTDRILRNVDSVNSNKTINVNQINVNSGGKKQHIYQNYVNVSKKTKVPNTVNNIASKSKKMIHTKSKTIYKTKSTELSNSSKSLKSNITPNSSSNTNTNLIKVQKARSISISTSHTTNPNVVKSSQSPMNAHISFVNRTANYHTIINKIYSKEFPHCSTSTNDILKLMLFLNEYLINNNLLKDYYLPKNKKILNDYSKYLADNITVDYPEQSDIDHSKLDKVVNCTKTIQRAWRRSKIKKFIGKKNNETHEIKKMVVTGFIRNTGFKAKRILGLFNSTVEAFELISNDIDTNEMFNNVIKLIKGTMTEYEKNILYKDYINKVIIGKL